MTALAGVSVNSVSIRFIFAMLSVDSVSIRFIFRILCVTLPSFPSQVFSIAWPMGPVR